MQIINTLLVVGTLFVGNVWGKHMFQGAPWSNALCAAFLGCNTALLATRWSRIIGVAEIPFCGSLFAAHNE